MSDYKRWCDIIAATPDREGNVTKFANHKELAKARDTIMACAPDKDRAGIIARHKSAKPKPEVNPAFANTHHDLGRLIEMDDDIITTMTAMILTLQDRIAELENRA